jgi:glycosyltransferase involved in cell wall biosynthesis
MPLVSIVIANYNYGRFLGEAIESALGQTHRDTEVVVVDDGSTDDSVAVAGQYPVRLVAQPNGGVSRARNAGAKKAQGGLLVFLDADDVLEPAFVERCWRVLSAEGPKVAYAYTQLRLFGTESGIEASKPFRAATLARGNFVPVTALVRREVFDRVGGFDPSWSLGYEDYELWLRMLDRGYRGVLVPEVLLRYRRHGHSRNALSPEQVRELHERLLCTYPRLHWRQIARHPVATVRTLLRNR